MANVLSHMSPLPIESNAVTHLNATCKGTDWQVLPLLVEQY